MSAADEVVVATWSEHSEIGHHYEDLLADGSVIAWTEPPFGETLYPGDDDPTTTRSARARASRASSA
ncbi:MULTISPECIES: hypothetical protein [Streptomyces]|uniref:hypothetical protein n=1 Tax=Streptomyces TaxID=1883 RepID=UPI00190BF428|nr:MULTISPECIES: hypothetical protein [unclassified Streptomyces]MBK3384667.1 hypothetical protein [Streptomyces sp. DEF147AK]MBK3390355.1 hypothetical protein [Streptomyces sp. DEF1AK]MCO6698805.1 hypothetical protein [Streptomyces sp. Vc17.3-30]